MSKDRYRARVDEVEAVVKRPSQNRGVGIVE